MFTLLLTIVFYCTYIYITDYQLVFCNKDLLKIGMRFIYILNYTNCTFIMNYAYMIY